ncbi:MAG: hypothetical protein HOL48_02060 [Porticoccaceae bacterium]|jgi:hypothetical protein|nr:hypothetical protein [Porticoccaceae bacterium]
MKTFLRSVFSPILNPFEKGDGEYNYSISRRVILLVVGPLMFLLSFGLLGLAVARAEFAAAVPSLVFFGVGLVTSVVGTLGTDRAVTNIWGNK